MSIISDFEYLRYYHAHLSDTPQVVSIFFMFTVSHSHVLSFEFPSPHHFLELVLDLDVRLCFNEKDAGTCCLFQSQLMYSSYEIVFLSF